MYNIFNFIYYSKKNRVSLNHAKPDHKHPYPSLRARQCLLVTYVATHSLPLGQHCLESRDRSKLACEVPKKGYVVDKGGVVSALASCNNMARGNTPLLPVLPGPPREPDIVEIFQVLIIYYY